VLGLLENISPLSIALIFVVGFSLVALASQWLAQRFMPGFHFAGATDLGEIFSDAIGGMFALLFALVTVAVWQNHDRMATTVSNEANVLHNVYRNLEPYPPEVRDPCRAKLKDYVNRVVAVEWPLVEQGLQDPGAHRLITDVNKLLLAYSPATLGELPRHGETLGLVTQYRGLRHDRIRGGLPYLDRTMWTALVLGAGIYIVYSSFFRVENRRAYTVMMATLGAALGLVFYMLVLYNFVFDGPGGIRPDPFRELTEKYWLID